MPNGQAGGFLGKAHDPFALMADPSQKDFKVPDLLPPDQIGAARLERRRKRRRFRRSGQAADDHVTVAPVRSTEVVGHGVGSRHAASFALATT